MRIRSDRSRLSSFITEHQILLRDQPVSYRALVEETVFETEEQESKRLASLFTCTYLRTAISNSDQRPVLFVFNGGPGSASLWLHLGLFGPRRLKMTDALNPSPLPPYELEDNPHTLLDICDLVMIDPVNTGYSRLEKPDAADLFFGAVQDTHAIALLIENWLIRHDRLNSPRFLVGESYGSARACFLLRELMGGPMTQGKCLPGIAVNGILLLGTAITLPVFRNEPPVHPAVLKLPAQAAVHHYHHPDGKPDLREFVEAAWQFAGKDYLAALFAGESLSAIERANICRRLSSFTGIAADWFDQNDLAVTDEDFRRLLLSGKCLDAGAYDGRYTMAHTSQISLADPIAEDPAMGKYTSAFIGAANSTLKAELEIGLEREYRAIDFTVNGQWDYNCPVAPTEALTAAMRRNEQMRVFFGSGLFDLVTHPGTVRYLVNHLNLPKSRTTLREYESGHMPYLGKNSADRLEADIRAFLQMASAKTENN